MSRWLVELSNQPKVRTSAGDRVVLERKTAALLAILAVDGPTSRARLAALLWPDSDEKKARGNLRQTLSRFRKLAGAELVESGDPLRLAEGVDTDWDELLHGASIPAAPLGVELLGGLDLSDCDELASWIDAANVRLRQALLGRLEAEADRLEQGDRPADVVAIAERILELDPVSERVHRRLIRLHYLAGDRAAAIQAFERCRKLLLDELGVEPDHETLELLRLVERGQLPSPPRRSHEIPPSVRRPPRIVGRDLEWARMKAAWDEGKILFVSGAAGMGKSRIARDFAAAQDGPVLLLEGRPGDAAVPYSSQARAVRQIFATYPGIEPVDWVRRELSRLLPELLQEGEDAPPPLADNDKVRFFQAHLELYRLVGTPHLTIFIDDMQFTDPASASIGQFMVTTPEMFGPDRILRTLFAFRPDQLPEELLRAADALVAAGLAERIELGPLDPDSVAELLRDLRVGASPALADDLSRAASGNPALVLELVKSLIQEGAMEGGIRAGASLPLRLDQLFRSRFGHLSASAMRLAQVAAAAGDILSLPLAAAVLGVHPLELGAPWRELEKAQVLHDGRFVHDLVRDAVLADLPAAVLAHLHASIATFLEREGADGTSIALHWQAAGEPARAAPYLIAPSGDAPATRSE